MPARLPPLLDWRSIQERLTEVFPEGLTHRQFVVREASAKSIFVMLYVGAIEGAEQWVRPNQIVRMTDEQAAKRSDDQRHEWIAASLRSSRGHPAGAWYAQNSREQIRDETFRQGLAEFGALHERPLGTTSSAGRYALRSDFAALFNPPLQGRALQAAINRWRKRNLSKTALARVALIRDASVATASGVQVRFPNGEGRQLAPGPSSLIAKAVIEEFAPRFLDQPVVYWLSESARKEDRRDATLSRKLGIVIPIDRHLPDIVLIDTGRGDLLFVFVEVVATDGPVTESRRSAILKLMQGSSYPESSIAFLTAYKDREEQAFRRTFSTLAWRSFAWCMAEPEGLIGLHKHHAKVRLRDLFDPRGKP
jgi:hypothetical protein